MMCISTRRDSDVCFFSRHNHADLDTFTDYEEDEDCAKDLVQNQWTVNHLS